MLLRVWLLVCHVWIIPWPLEGGYSEEFLVEQLPEDEDQYVFRPRTAKEAAKHAAREAEKQRSSEAGYQYALLQGAGIGPKGIRVAVNSVAEVTTSRYNYPRSRNFRKVSEWPDSRQNQVEQAVLPPRNPYAHQSFSRKPQYHTQEQKEQKPQQKYNGHDKRKSWQRGGDRGNQRHFRNLKRKRDKRQVDNTYIGGNFELPPMSNEIGIKKKKKKKKKKITTTGIPTTKKMQKHSKKFRIYMESSEVNLEKGRVRGRAMDLVRGLSKEMDQLLAGTSGLEEEPFNEPQQTELQVQKQKYMPIPKNWQNPPSWRPPTRAYQGVRHAHRGRWKPMEGEFDTPYRYQPPQPVTQPVTEFNCSVPQWKSYNHPLKDETEVGDGLVLKPAPSDWPEPTHPADGIYDWHKAQLRRAPRTQAPFPTNSVPGLYDDSHNRYNFRGGPRMSRHFVRYTAAPTTWSWARPAEDQRVMYQSKQMWQTRPWLTRVHPPPGSTYPTIGTKAAFIKSAVDEVQTELDINQIYKTREGRWVGPGGYRRTQGPPSDQTHLTPRPPSATLTEAEYQQGRHASAYYHGSYFYQNEVKEQSRMKPPSYFYNALEEIQSVSEANEGMVPTLEAPYRLPDEYAGNDRDLRAPLPLPISSYTFPTSRWTPARFKLEVRHSRYSGPRYRRVTGARPTGYRSLFTVPLQRGTTSYSTSHP